LLFLTSAIAIGYARLRKLRHAAQISLYDFELYADRAGFPSNSKEIAHFRATFCCRQGKLATGTAEGDNQPMRHDIDDIPLILQADLARVRRVLLEEFKIVISCATQPWKKNC
jgi:hypothetical protein